MERQTTTGPIVGFIDTHELSDRSTASLAPGSKSAVLKYLGVPYAQAERWQRPTPAVAWTEPRSCVEFGPAPGQGPSGTSLIYGGGKKGVIGREWITQSEKDCLSLNIFAPGDMQPHESLPTLVWIYGGSLNNGDTSKFLYDPTEMIRDAHGKRFVVVTVNYRVGIFGFFSGPDVLADDKDGLSGNYGLYDVVAALEWVNANAKSFGIDTTRITAFGESAGAFIVSALLVCRRRLFTRAIMQSGAPGTMQIRPLEKAYPAYAQILNFHGTGAATAAARMKMLRAVPWKELQQGHNDSHSFGGVGLTIESGPHATWKESIADVLKRGEIDEWVQEVIIGTNEDEGSMFAMLMPHLNQPAGFSAYTSKFGSTVQDHYSHLYPASYFETLAANDFINAPASKVIADQLFIDPARRLADSLATSTKTRVYMYRCRQIVSRLMTEKLNLGAMHSIEIPLVFNTKTLWEEGTKEAKSAADMGERWISFADTGVPKGDWQAYTTEDPAWLAFNLTGDSQMEQMK